MKIFETHTHLDSKEFNKDRDKIIEKCKKNGIEYMINIGCNERTSENSIALAEKYDFIYATVGYHPHDATEFDANVVRKLAKHKKVVAIGEIGLDYYRNLSPVEVQKDVFEQQVKIALELNLPLVIHDRDAHEDTFNILKANNAKRVVFHCFSGDVLFAEKVLAEGWKISFTGQVTYRKNLFSDTVRMVPDDAYFVETDAPYLTPVPYRGKRNSPLYLPEIIQHIAYERMQTPNQIALDSLENAKKFFFPKKKKK
ncbi:MAG: hypothetical protein B6226_05090 [Candidatus Cloacimonetes bacterium 4572_65]|nr:MAG: hypothetical protein B6226_05090 [Candidatus Cloacimonetes bacterium 4572_65]